MRFIYPILFISMSAILYIFIANPFYKEIVNLRSDLVIYNTALDNSTNLENKQNSLINTYNGIKQSDIERLNSFLPDTVNNIQLILEVERIANLHSLAIKDTKFEAIQKEIIQDPSIVSDTQVDNSPFGIFPIEFTLEGKYDNFNLFLKDLEYNLRLVDTKSISFSVPEVNDKIVAGIDPDVYSYKVKVETYWLK